MQDPLNKVEEENNNLQNKDKFYYVMSYIPLLQFIFVFSDIKKSTQLQKHMNQGITLFITYFILLLVLGIIGLYTIIGLMQYAYFGLVIYLAGNAYNGVYINIPMVEEISKILKSFTGGNKNTEDNINKDKNDL